MNFYNNHIWVNENPHFSRHQYQFPLMFWWELLQTPLLVNFFPDRTGEYLMNFLQEELPVLL